MWIKTRQNQQALDLELANRLTFQRPILQATDTTNEDQKSNVLHFKTPIGSEDFDFEGSLRTRKLKAGGRHENAQNSYRGFPVSALCDAHVRWGSKRRPHATSKESPHEASIDQISPGIGLLYSAPKTVARWRRRAESWRDLQSRCPRATG